MPRLPLIALAALACTPALAAPRPTGEEALQTMIAGRTAGKPQDCLWRTRTMDSTTIDGVGLVYKDGRTLYVNRFQNGCAALDQFATVITRTPDVQLCRGDMARIVDLQSRIDRNTCVLGQFTPYAKAK